MLDGYGCSYDALKDLTTVYNFLDRCPDRIGMTKIAPPHVIAYSGIKPEDWGLSGFVLIAESHISIHTFPEKRYLSLDIFSCKPFDVEDAIAEVVRTFDVHHYEHRLFDRGSEFPHSIGESSRLVDLDRFRVVSERPFAS
ncbi:MAG: adenosylmethionine decarboxylase [Candidatus Poribacteria bacterium]|nr:MAG: adenosylmethionine decarboxylase [Candidatus Poribacteria bacterium]